MSRITAVGPVMTIVPVAVASVEDVMDGTKYDRLQDGRRVDEIERICLAVRVQICRETRSSSLEALDQLGHAIEGYHSE